MNCAPEPQNLKPQSGRPDQNRRWLRVRQAGSDRLRPPASDPIHSHFGIIERHFSIITIDMNSIKCSERTHGFRNIVFFTSPSFFVIV